MLERLRGIVGLENISTDEVDLLVYSQDASEIVGKPDVIVWPTFTDQVSKIMKLANEFSIPVVPRGAGTCRSGGPVPTKGGILLVMTKMNKILEIDAHNFQVLVEPGITLVQLNKALKPYGLFLPPDPASEEACTIGGCVAECGGGIRAVKYGTFRDWVLGLEVVLPTGEVIMTGSRTRKWISGYDLTRFFIGSEGTLGIITKVRLRLFPIPPRRLTMLANFDDLEKASRAVFHIIRQGLLPSGAELMDEYAVKVVSDYLGIAFKEGTSLLLMEFDGTTSEVKRQLRIAEQVCVREGATSVRVAETEEESERLWRARKAVSPALSTIKPSRFAEDVVVPISRIPDFVKEVRKVAKKYGLLIPIYGHVGDGNLHPTILFDERNAEEVRKAKMAVDEVVKIALNLGGALSGEHGIGLSKAKYFAWEHSVTEIELMRRLKRVFDPNNILNPGKIFES